MNSRYIVVLYHSLYTDPEKQPIIPGRSFLCLLCKFPKFSKSFNTHGLQIGNFDFNFHVSIDRKWAATVTYENSDHLNVVVMTN